MRDAGTIGTVTLLGALALGGAALAADGVYEINQSCVTTGCFPGDSGGYPVTGQAGQSYVLTSNLAVTDADVTAINLNEGSTLDLNGFSITGPAQCTGTPPSCVGLGAGRGVLVYGGGATIRNGRIAGMGGDGISGDAGTRVEKMVIEANGDDGVEGVGGNWSITECRILRNKDAGVSVAISSPSGVVSRNIIWGNGGVGVYGSQIAVTENAIYNNGGLGLSLFSGAGPAYNAIYRNNGGAAQPQSAGTTVETGPNSCEDGACP